MTSGSIIQDARVARIRELKAELAETKARLAQAEADRTALLAHFPLALAALRDFELAAPDSRLLIVDGWNAVLRDRNVPKLTSEDVSKLKAEYLAALGINPQSSTVAQQPLTTWIVFDGPEENSYRSGPYRVSYTGGTGPHRADRMILDYVHAAKILGLDVSRISVETADKALAKKLASFGAAIVSRESHNMP